VCLYSGLWVFIYRSMGVYVATLETALKQIFVKLNTFNNRISFASGRMELIQGTQIHLLFIVLFVIKTC
jgi:hypothetical protein